MKFLGFEMVRRTVALVRKAAQSLSSVYSSSYSWLSGWPIREWDTGYWQKNIVVPDSETSLLASSAVYACVTGIASDVGKMRIKLDKDVGGIWEEITTGSPWLPVLRKPNHYQNRIEFIEQWIASKLLYGNAYILKQRADKRGLVTAMYVLHPRRVTPLVADNGDVYYQLSADYLSEVSDQMTVPASEIIHDRMVGLWHPLVGVPPIYACAMSATMANRIQNQSTAAFANGGRPSGIILIPGSITDEQARSIKKEWEANYSGANVGRTAVLADSVKFEPLAAMTAESAQLTEQLRWTVEDVGRAFHYPQWKLGGPVPPYSAGPQATTMQYYCDCLQTLVEKVELCLDEGLELPADMGTEMDLDNLLRMDTVALYDSNNKAEKWMKVDEMRFRANLPKITGGDTVYRQHQDYSIESLAKRDAQEDPFKGLANTPGPQPPSPPPNDPKPKQVTMEELDDEIARTLKWCLSLSSAQIDGWIPETSV